jgi:exopolyphosphatase / guanosine-5'-triphosphate,3'-diphosphate pyrophosphatase
VQAAVLDVGSNSVRLLLAEGLAPGGVMGERVVTITGLRRAATADGSVSPAALARLDTCLADYAQRIIAAGSPPVVAVGTAAVREAPNRAAIERVVRSRLGVDLIVIPGEREAALAFSGARLVLDAGTGPCRVVDIGGGSTEVVQGDGSGPAHAVSLALGVNRQGETHITADPPPAGEVSSIRAEAAALVGEAAGAFPADGPLVGVAGTVTQVAAIAVGHYDADLIHGMTLSCNDVEGVLHRVAAVAADGRARIAGLHPDRVNVIVPGAAILLGVLEALDSPSLVVSERDILDGIAMDPGLAGIHRAG